MKEVNKKFVGGKRNKDENKSLAIMKRSLNFGRHTKANCLK